MHTVIGIHTWYMMYRISSKNLFGTKLIIMPELCPVNIQHSSCACILLPFIAYIMCNDLCRKLEAIFHNLVKGVHV